jgi:hypothetical protein
MEAKRRTERSVNQTKMRNISEDFNVQQYYVEIKCQLDATDEIFIADLIACSTCFGHPYAHHQEL